MSIRVTIEVLPATGRPVGAQRYLTISNLNDAVPLVRDHDQVDRYEVALSNGRLRTAEATFKHRFGDDVLTLVAEAITALGYRPADPE